MTATMNTPASLIRCRHCGDQFDGPERPCPSPLAVEQLLAASGPEDYVATRRALIAAYARVMAVP